MIRTRPMSLVRLRRLKEIVMEEVQLNAGASQLTNTLTRMMRSISDKPPALDFGVINGDYSLSTNLFRQAIPKSEYSVCRQLLYDPSVPLTKTYTDGEHGHPEAGPPGTHSHEVRLPAKMRWLKPGDKVLVAWIQNEAVVIDIVYNAGYLGSGEPGW